MVVRLQRDDFDPGTEIARLSEGRTDIGGMVSFIGLVRDFAPQVGAIKAMTIEHYPGMTEAELDRIEAEARRRWPLIDCLIIHRYGRLLPGERIVLVATASAHRKAALEACAFLIDWLKIHAPFWKKEESAQGSHWVAARAEDDEAAKNWA